MTVEFVIRHLHVDSPTWQEEADEESEKNWWGLDLPFTWRMKQLLGT